LIFAEIKQRPSDTAKSRATKKRGEKRREEKRGTKAGSGGEKEGNVP